MREGIPVENSGSAKAAPTEDGRFAGRSEAVSVVKMFEQVPA